MKRTTIMLPQELKTRVERRARRQGVSLGEFVRESLESYLQAGTDPESLDTYLADQAVHGGGGLEDLAQNHDHYLYDEET